MTRRRESPPLIAAPSTDLGAVVVRTLEERWTVLLKALDNARKKTGGRRVHDLRVALRRMASVAALVSEIVDSRAERSLRKRVERLLKRLGRLRDTHVQRKAIGGMTRRFPVLVPLRARLEKREREREEEVAHRLAKVDVDVLQTRFEEVAAEALLALSSSVLIERHRQTLLDAVNRRFARLIDRRRDLDVANLETMHAMRVAFKKFRYMVEVLQPVLVGMGQAQLDAMQAFQTMMGDVHDLDELDRRVAAWRVKHGKNGDAFVAAQDDIGRRLLQKTDALMAAADDIHGFWNQSYLPAVEG